MNKNTKIVWKPIDELIPYEHNAKEHTEKQLANLEESFRRYGWQQPCLITNDNVIITGHGRAIGAKRAGLTDAPCIYCDDLSEKEIKEYRHLDNLLSDGEYIQSELEFELPELDFSGFDLEFDVDFGEEEKEIIEDDVPEVNEETEPICKLGDIWQLGNHRLVCGDSTDPAVIDRLMDGVKAKLLLTDPPYGIKADKGFSGAGGFNKPIERRHYKDNWDSERPEKDVFDYICLMAEKAIIFGGNFFTDELPVGNHWLVWNKHNTMPTFSDAELAWTNIKRNSVKIYDVEWNGLIGKEKERFHPTQKPVKLFADILNDYTEENDAICDFFGGSGSTLIACEQLNRKCYMCELDPHYCDVILQRYINLKGSDADVFLLKDGEKIPYSDVKS